MRNVKKKLLSLLLVVVLMICAVPFQAMAADDGYEVFVQFVNEDENKLYAQTITTATEITIIGLKSYIQSNLEFVEAWQVDKDGIPIGTDPVDPTRVFPVDQNLFFVIVVKEKATTPPEGDNSDSDDVELLVPIGGGDEDDEGNEPESYTVYIDYTEGSEGEPAQKYTMTDGQVFGSRLPAKPLRDGMTFLRWVYAGTNIEVDSEDELDGTKADSKGNIYIKAKWNLKSLFLTLDENRQGEEYVNHGVSVTVGEKIFSKVDKYHPTRKGYVFMGWFLNGMKIVPDTVYDLPDSATAYAKWEKESDVPGRPNPNEKDGKIYLEIYLNGDFALAKRVDITSYAADGIITRAEAEKVVKKYYSAKNGYKLSFEGLFDEESWYFYTRDPETNGAASIDVDLWTDHYVYVMVKNVKVSAADTTNPKTGDVGILMPLIGMFSSAAAAAYVFKKRH